MKKVRLITKHDGPVRCYSGEMIKTGDVIELNDWLFSKAVASGNYEEVTEQEEKSESKNPKDLVSKGDEGWIVEGLDDVSFKLKKDAIAAAESLMEKESESEQEEDDAES